MMPRSLFGQVAALTLTALFIAQVAAFWVFSVERAQSLRNTQKAAMTEQAIQIAELIQTAPHDIHETLTLAASSNYVSFEHAQTPVLVENWTPIDAWENGRQSEHINLLHNRFSPPGQQWLRDLMKQSGFAPVKVTMSLPIQTGDWLNVTAQFDSPAVLLPPEIIGLTAFLLLLTGGALWLGLRRVTKPLEVLTALTSEIGVGPASITPPTHGPREARQLAEALQQMQQRLSDTIDARTQMLAALGHDLRSPLTALRLQAEMIDEDETRERIIVSLEEMQDMTEATLAYARGVNHRAPTEQLSLPEMLTHLADELAGQGPEITVHNADVAPIFLRKIPMQRVFRNLFENAQRYGQGAEVTVSQMAAGLRVEITDFGPGIPEGDLERVFNPFERLEKSRSAETGGNGLGLAIARSIIEGHGGTIWLSNHAKHGLTVCVQIPFQM